MTGGMKQKLVCFCFTGRPQIWYCHLILVCDFGVNLRPKLSNFAVAEK